MSKQHAGSSRRVIVAGSFSVLLALLAGCGGSSSKTTASASSSTAAATAAPSASTASATRSATKSAGAAPATHAPASKSAPAPVTAPTSAQTVTLGVRVANEDVPGLGQVLTNGASRTLYIFVPDNRSKVTCTGSCAVVWPPLKLPSGATPLPAGEVKATLTSSKPDPEGGRVITYAGWPLYTYAGDSEAGTAKGQALNLNGGVWYVIAPSGQVIRKAP